MARVPSVDDSWPGTGMARWASIAVALTIIVVSGMPRLASAADGEGTAGASPYVSTGNPIVVNILDGNTFRFLQIGVQIGVSTPGRAAEIEHHRDAIRHALIILFSSQDIQVITGLKGKEQLRRDTLMVVRKVIAEQLGSDPVDEVYFTSFIIQ